MKGRILRFVFQLSAAIAACAAAPVLYGQSDEDTLLIKITDTGSEEPMPILHCVLENREKGRYYTALCDESGTCLFRNIPDDIYNIKILYFNEVIDGGKIDTGSGIKEYTVKAELRLSLREVTVSATEPKGSVTKSVIGEDAMKHLQPSSIADVLELIPGGRAADPSFSSAQIIRLREADPIGGDYSTSSLGTQFTIDGIPISTDANLQSTPVYSGYGSSFVNRGVDMRSIPTDDIESVEIVRGIASAEYGDLTSGMVNIRRRNGGRDFTARFKADMKSKLIYIGKGFETSGPEKPLKINVGGGFLDSRADPRNTRQNYKRLNASFRIGRDWNSNDKFLFSVSGSLDYSGSFDNAKSDRDLDFGTHGPVEKYSSGYNRFSGSADFRITSRQAGFFRYFNIKAAVSADMDIIDRWKYVAMGSEVPLSTAREEGEYDVEALPTSYEATLKVKGIPFNSFIKGSVHLRFGPEKFRNNIKAGIEWDMDKNYGEGIIFDVERPFSPDMNVRPRAFNSIPAIHIISAFIEDNAGIEAGKARIDIMAGIRISTMMNISSRYSLNGKVHADPRINAMLTLPSFDLAGSPFGIYISAGAGIHTKYPTMDYLYPEQIYYDITQMNFWPEDKEKRRINLKVFKIDPSNYGLDAARNLKWEIRTDLEWKGNSLSVTYFREDMTSGFRSQGRLIQFIYKDYDEQSIDLGTLDDPPELDKVPYVTDTLLTVYGVSDNGSRTLKEGVEFTFVSARIRPIRTRIMVSGAWFRTTYMNSLPDFGRPSSIVGGEVYPYIGYYAETEKYLRESFNTNFTFDTQIPRLGLIFTTSFQCLWFTGSQTLYVDPYPEYYIDKKGIWHEFTAASAEDGVLSQLIDNRDESVFRYNRIPFCMNINLKITKTLFDDKLSLSVFVNKLLDYTPPYYTSHDVLVRRSVQPYFGMELNLKI